MVQIKPPPTYRERAPMTTPAPLPPPRPRSAALLAALSAELDQHPEFDQDLSIRTVSVVVVLHERTGRPVRIMWRTEGQRDLNEQPRRLE